jgi:hypothetical protein
LSPTCANYCEKEGVRCIIRCARERRRRGRSREDAGWLHRAGTGEVRQRSLRSPVRNLGGLASQSSERGWGNRNAGVVAVLGESGASGGRVCASVPEKKEPVGEERTARWVLSVRERKKGAAGVFFPGWSAGPLAPGRPSWAGFFFFLLLFLIFCFLLCCLKK